MKFSLEKIVLLLVSLFLMFVTYTFRTVPISQFWKGWRILYVYTDTLSEYDILTILEKHGCESVISAANQKLPIVSPMAPVQVQPSDSYLNRRGDFFTDKSRLAQVFYIPDSQSANLEEAVMELSAFAGSSAGTDGKSSFPWFAPSLCLLFFITLFYFSKKRMLLAFVSLPFLFLAFCRPLFTLSAAISLCLFAFFVFHRTWGRKDFFKTSLNSPYVLLLSLSPVLVMLVSSPLSSLFYIIALANSALLMRLYYLYELDENARCSFQPVYIRTARMFPLLGKSGIRLLSLLLIALILIVLSFRFFGNVSGFSSSVTMPSLPSPVSGSDSELVQLKDFVNWSWNTATFPYRKLGKKVSPVPQEGDSVSITDYQNVNGKIVPSQVQAFVFNNDFRESVYRGIESLEYPALEKMLLKQGKNSGFAYSKKAGNASSERFGMLLLLIFITIPTALGINYILGRKRYGLSI